ncbi:CHAT domain-containing protein [Intrasporangium sp.]|uniref:CHAT domain-containing protein n=1 Tax=Intrasporangium sp. TaxID=1925024 RepID=UPI0032217B4D
MTREQQQSWDGYVDGAIASPDGAASWALTRVCLANSVLLERPQFTTTVAEGLPPGRPTRATTRRAAAHLAGIDPAGEQALTIRRAVGRLHRWTFPDPRRGDIDETSRAIADAEHVGDVARQLGDPDLAVWAGLVAGVAEYRAARATQAVARLRFTVDAALDVLDSTTFDLGEALASPDLMGAARTWRLGVLSAAARRLRQAASSAGDFENLTYGSTVREQFLPELSAVKPRAALAALQSIAAGCRLRGDRAGAMRAVNDMKAIHDLLTGEEQLDALKLIRQTEIHNAESLKDWETYRRLSRERLEWVINTVAANVSTDIEPTAENVIAHLHATGDRAWTGAIGNCALGEALAVYRLGLSKTSPAEWDAAWRSLAVAEAAFGDWGANGFDGIKIDRARLLADLPADRRPPPSDIIATMIDVSRTAKSGGSRRNAVLDAIEVSAPGDTTVLHRLEEMIAADHHVHGPRLRGGRVKWLRKNGAAQSAPQELEPAALAAAGDLEVEGRLQDAVLAAECWIAAAEAGRTLGRNTNVTLERLLQAVRCLSIQLVTVTSTRERRDLGRKYSPLLRQVADLAIQMDDPAAAERVMELVRRDRVGSVLVSLSRDPAVSAMIRDAAEKTQLANTVIPAAPDEVPPEEVRRWVARTATEQNANQQAARERANQILGPLAVLADATSLDTATSKSLLAQRSEATTGQAAAILQLLPTHGGFLNSDDTTLYWVVTLAHHGGTITHECGRADLDVTSEDLKAPRSFRTAYYLSESLIPEVLRDFLLENGSPENPVRLTVVPTGLLEVPFDALVLDETAGVQLVDRAAITVVGSVATATSLRERSLLEIGHDTAAPWITVFDTKRLPGTKDEDNAIRAAHTLTLPSTSATDLIEQMCQGTAALLAMGVHGSDGDGDGWNQTKLMPDGTQIRALEVLAARAPRHCVLTSCNTTLNAHHDVEQEGFPMALLIAGASVIVGTIADIPDRVTGQIMTQYWPRIAAGDPPDIALHHAKRTWLREHPTHRATPQTWAALTVYGNAP